MRYSETLVSIFAPSFTRESGQINTNTNYLPLWNTCECFAPSFIRESGEERSLKKLEPLGSVLHHLFSPRLLSVLMNSKKNVETILFGNLWKYTSKCSSVIYYLIILVKVWSFCVNYAWLNWVGEHHLHFCILSKLQNWICLNH